MNLRDNKGVRWLVYITCWLMVFMPSAFGFGDWQYWVMVLGAVGIYWIGILDGGNDKWPT